MNSKHEPRQPDAGSALSPHDQALWQHLKDELDHAIHAGLCISADTARVLEHVCPPASISRDLQNALDNMIAGATQDLEFEALMEARRQQPTLGSYLSFLRQKDADRAVMAQKEADLDLFTITELERDQMRPKQIPTRPLAVFVRELQGSLEQLEQLLFTTIKEPPYLVAGSRSSLYRGERNATRRSSEAASLSARGEVGERRENPDHRAQTELVQEMIHEIRSVWND